MLLATPPPKFEPYFLLFKLMSHKKALSQGSIPFSWEDKPGVCKTLNDEYPPNTGSRQSINKKSSFSLTPPSPSHLDNSTRVQKIQGKKIPLPPCPSQPPHRSTSGKGFKWQEDPFLVAYKECTKSEKNGKLPSKNKKGIGSNFSVRRSKFVFSCRSISDVRDDGYLKLSQAPPRISAVRNRSLTLEDDRKRDFNYEPWL